MTPIIPASQDEPASLGTVYPAAQTPTEPDDDIRFDYELRDPLSAYGAYALVIAAVLALLILALAILLL